MRFIYVDETGRSAATDPAIIVLCIIVDADKQYAAAESPLAETLATAPARYRDGLIAHAWEILNSNRYKEGWAHQDRLRLLAAADEYICRHGRSDEVSTVVAENISEMESRLLRFVRDLTSGTVKLSQEPGAREYRILRMTDTVHFVAKEDGPFLQIIDACAWVFQRFMSGRRFGPELFEAMTGLPVGTIAAGVHPRELSFKHTVQIWIEWTSHIPNAHAERCQATLLRLIAQRRVGNRHGRIEPRARKRRPKSYQWLKVPRRRARRQIRLHGYLPNVSA